MKRLFALALVSLFAGAGCGASVDQTSSVQVMNAALVGTGQAQSKFLQPNASGGQFSGEVTNPQGSGSAQASGSVESTQNSWNATFDITYDHWYDAGSHITIDGSLHETATFSSLTPLIGSMHLSGMLTASGAVNANVDFDLTVTYSTSGVDIAGSVGGSSIHTGGA